MALSPSEEALVRDLIAQNAALLSLASSEPTILSKLGATKATLSDLPVASSLADTDLFLVRQGTTDKSVARSVVSAGFAARNGSASQLFNVAAANAPTHAVRLEQVTPITGNHRTWQNFIGSRVASTAYQNTSGKEIVVAIRADASAGVGRLIEVSSDATTWIPVGATGQADDSEGTCFPVPTNWYYRINGAVATITAWAELR